MNNTVKIITVFLVLWAVTSAALSANEFMDAKATQEKLKSLAGQYPGYAKYKVLATTPGGNSISVLTIGTGNVAEKPAIAVVGGIEGPHLFGSSLAIDFAEEVLGMSGNDPIRGLLDSVCFYV